MNKLLFPLGFVTGLLVAYVLFNRFTPIQVSSGTFGKMDVFTGESCVFSGNYYPTEVQATKNLYGLDICK